MQQHGNDRGGRRQALGALLLAGMAAGGAAGAASRAAAAPAGGDSGVDELLARTAIQEVLMAYARGNDRNDVALIRSCFWPESTHRHGGFSGKSYDFVNVAGGIIARLKHCAHFITNVSIRVSGPRAFSECYYFAHHRRDAANGGGEEDAFFEGRYLDFHEQRDGVWKIIRRRGLSDLTVVTPAATPYASWPEGQHSLHDRNDDYYRMLAEFERGA